MPKESAELMAMVFIAPTVLLSVCPTMPTPPQYTWLASSMIAVRCPCPFANWNGRHVPSSHVPPRQSWPQLPQFFASVVLSTHVSPQIVVPVSVQSDRQIPLTHVAVPPTGAVQAGVQELGAPPLPALPLSPPGLDTLAPPPFPPAAAALPPVAAPIPPVPVVPPTATIPPDEVFDPPAPCAPPVLAFPLPPVPM